MIKNSETFEDPHKKIQERVDQKTAETRPMYLSPELRKVDENLKFIDKIARNQVKKGVHAREVFGVVTVDPRTVVYGDNIWNRSIFTVDELCDIHDSATLEQQLKYAKKKRKMDSKLIFMIILLGIGGMAVFVMLLLMGVFGG